jgi:EmrB/QacA subfamily drug resistance transporter
MMERKWWTLVAVCLGTFMLLLDVTIVNVALPDIQQSLHSSFSDLQWVVDAYALSLASLLLTAGSLADLFGRRLLFSVGLVLFTVGSLFCGLAQSSEWLILARAGQGVGGAIMFSTSLALLAQAFQGRERGVAFGIWGSITGVAVAVGPVVGGILTSGLSWKWIFFVNVPIGAFAVAVTLLRVEESRQEGARRPDWAGFVVFTAALVSLIYALIRSSEKGWTETGVVVLFALAAVLLAVFLLQEHRSDRAMFDLSLFRNHTFDGGAIAAFGLSGSLFALLLYVVLYLQDGKGYSALGTGVRLLVLSGAIMVAATVAGRLTQNVPVRFLIGPGLLLVGIGLFLMARLNASSDWTVLIPGFVVGGLGTGMVNPPLASTAVGVVEPRRAGMASGINSTFRQVGISTGVAALGSIFGSEVASQLRHNLGATLPAGQVTALSKAIEGGESSALLAHAPASERARLAHATLASYAHGLDVVLVIGGVLAVISGVAALLLIRTSDFESSSQRAHVPGAEPAAPEAATT